MDMSLKSLCVIFGVQRAPGRKTETYRVKLSILKPELVQFQWDLVVVPTKSHRNWTNSGLKMDSLKIFTRYVSVLRPGARWTPKITQSDLRDISIEL